VVLKAIECFHGQGGENGKGDQILPSLQTAFFGLAYLLGRVKAYKIASLISSIMTSGVVFRLYSPEELLRYAASLHNRCVGTTLEMITQLLFYGQSTIGRILLAYMLSASLAGSYLRRQDMVEAQELGATLYVTIVIIVVCVVLNMGASGAVWTCIP